MFEAARTRIAAGVRRVLSTRLARRFVRRQDGAAAIEFALVALPFLALTFAILETSLVFFAGQALEAAAADSGRLIMTGQAQTGGFDKDAFKNAVCDRMASLFDCKDKVYVDVRTFTSTTNGSSTTSAFSNAATQINTSPIQNGKFDSSKVEYDAGGPNDIVVVTLYYEWPIYVTLLGNGLDDLNGGNRLLVATSVFKNEPYE